MFTRAKSVTKMIELRIIIMLFANCIFELNTVILKLPKCGKYDAMFSGIYPYSRITDGIVETIIISQLLDCLHACLFHPTCRSINLNKKSNQCELVDEDYFLWYNTLLTTDEPWYHYQTEDRKQVIL